MRTTIDIDEDVLLAVKELAGREKRSAGSVLSELARTALTGPLPANEVAEPESFYGFRPVPRRGVIITNALVEKLREESGD